MAAKTKQKKRKTKGLKLSTNVKKAIAIIAAIAVIIGAVSLAVSNKSHSKSNFLTLDKNTAYGIDVSQHNGKIDWEKVKGEVDFAFIRVGCRGYTNGTIALDKKAKYNLKNANKANVPVGVYIYSQAINEKEAQEEAEFLLKHIKSYDISLPVVIDFEYAYKYGERVGRLADAKLSKKERTSLINAFCARVKKAGYVPAVYASSYIYRSQLNMKTLDKNAVIWVADYNSNVSYKGDFDIWQFSNRGKCSGVSSKYVDTNYWYLEE